MRLVYSFGIILLLLVSCNAKKNVHNTTANKKYENLRSLKSNFNGKNSSKIKNILKVAEKYLGVPYQFGGNTPKGMDCSGLVCKVFNENNTQLPRRSEDQSKLGEEVSVEKIQPGDLLFFATSASSRVTHVGIVQEVNDSGEISFIHASTSKGVIISSLNEKYWNKAYLFARRVYN